MVLEFKQLYFDLFIFLLLCYMHLHYVVTLLFPLVWQFWWKQSCSSFLRTLCGNHK